MATERIERSVEDLEREVTCAICQCHYTEPKVLPCCHYYCKECVRSLAVKVGVGKPFSCPECRTATTLPEGGVDDLPTAFFVNRIKEVLSRLSRAYGKVVAACEMCSGPTADAFCRHCAMFICSECVRQHQRMKVFTSHVVIFLNDLKSGRSEDIVVPKPPLKVCEAHDQPMNIYCFDCSCLICRDCTIKVHNDHNHEFLKVAAPEMKKSLVAKLEPLKKAQADLSHAVEEVHGTKSTIKAQGYLVLNKIDSLFSELVENLNIRKQELFKATAAQVEQEAEDLCVQEKELSTASAVIQSVIEYTMQCIDHLSDDEVMCTHSEIEDQIDREVAKYGQGVKPVFRLAVEAQVKQPKPERTRPSFIGTVLSGLGKPYGVSMNSARAMILTEPRNLTLLDTNGKWLKSVPASDYGVDLLRGVAVDDATGNIFVTCTQNIIKLTPDLEFIKKISTDSGCMGITVVKNTVFVCGDVCLVYNMNLVFMKQFPGNSDKGEASHFHSVCADQDDNLYFTNCGNLTVSSYSYDGIFLRTFEQVTPAKTLVTPPSTPSVRFIPTGLCISGGYVYVANQKTHSITIFTTGGKYVGRKAAVMAGLTAHRGFVRTKMASSTFAIEKESRCLLRQSDS